MQDRDNRAKHLNVIDRKDRVGKQSLDAPQANAPIVDISSLIMPKLVTS